MKKNTLILGLLRGDEGKGKIVDYLADQHNVIVRYAGGPNAGHSIYRNDKLFVTHIIPSGIFEKRLCIIGRGCVVNLKKLYKEYLDIVSFIKENLPDLYINQEEQVKSLIKLSYGAHIITDQHIIEDTNRENAGKGNGSTKQGISPAYRDKYYRTGCRVIDYLNNENNKSLEYYQFIKNIAFDEEHYLNTTTNSCLFEGAQGVLLDIDNPYYPNVSSSSVGVGGIITGTGISYMNLMQNFKVIGIVKVYMSSVGTGKFLTEIINQVERYTDGESTLIYNKPAERLREVGKEYGATTGRPRKVGWMDIPLLNYSIRTTGVNELCLTRLDTLRNTFYYEEYVPVCIGYKDKFGNIIKTANIWNLENYIPVYKFIKLWKKESLKDVDFVNFIKFIEYETNIPVKYISIGKNKNDIIER